MRELPTGTVTLLFTDIEGSTRMLQELGREAYVLALTEHRRLLRDAFTRHGGVEVEMQGDSFFFAFPFAREAVAATIAAQRALEQHTWERQPIRVRIGLHTGEPMQADGLYAGLDVHRAARVMSAAHGGQALVSDRTAALVEGELPTGARLLDLGEHRLKDLATPQRLYQLGEGIFPPLKTISNTNLPRPASSFIGREREVAEVLACIAGGARLVTLTGPGGSGKTRLALEAAASVIPEFKAGVAWVGLATLRDPALVLETIAETLGANDGLAEHIGDREQLVLLDNVEQVVDAAPEIAGLLETCPNLTVLVTSRELLRVRGEVEYQVPPLAQPEAVALFCERAQLAPSNASNEIDVLCARLDSLPLAVELAAARTKALSPAQILARLEQRLDLLKGGRDVDPRQQTLRATIQWSYELLAHEEQTVFAGLSVFAGGCSLEAAEEVAGAALDTLQSLVEKSLLRFSDERYWMLETVREYASERLVESGELEATQWRHASFLLRLAAGVETALGTDPELHNRFASEHDNFRAALAWAEQARETECQLDLIGRSWTFWWYRGHAGEGLRWVESALAASEGEASARTVKVLAAGAMFAYRRKELPTLKTYAEESLRIARTLNDARTTTWPLILLGIWASEVGEYEEAARLCQEAIAVAAATNDRRLVGIATNNLGNTAMHQGDFDRAASLFQASLEVSRELGAIEEIPIETCNLAMSLYSAGRMREAEDASREGVAVANEIGSHNSLAYGFVLLGVLAWRLGHRQIRAARLFGMADMLLDRAGEPIGEHAELLDPIVKELTTAMGDVEYAKAFAEGRATALDEAVAVALATVD